MCRPICQQQQRAGHSLAWGQDKLVANLPVTADQLDIAINQACSLRVKLIKLRSLLDNFFMTSWEARTDCVSDNSGLHITGNPLRAATWV